MNFDIPILVEQQRGKGRTSFFVRPLFLQHLRARRDRLGSALSKLTSQIRKEVELIRGSADEADYFSRLGFNPDAQVSRQKVAFHTRRDYLQLSTCVVTFSSVGRNLAFLPADSDLWFEYEGKDEFRPRLIKVLSDDFQQAEKPASARGVEDLKTLLTARGTPWLTHLRMDINTQHRKKSTEQEDRLSFFGRNQSVSGAAELNKIGNCLDLLFPDDLHRAIQREDELEKLRSLLDTSDRRPVLILGQAKVGKSTLIHEHIYRVVRERNDRQQHQRNTWHLAPQRIVAGMSYVGQWEERVLAILDFMKKKRHTLYLNDMLGMYQAGVHSKSTLSAADLLKPFIERRDLQLLVEMTPGQFRVFRERDRSFADMFQILRLDPTSEEDTLRILVREAQTLEKTHRVCFELDVIPGVLELSRRYDRESAFPGKAAQQLRELAVRHGGREVTRDTVLADFRLRTGFRESFVDSRQTFDPQAMFDELNAEVLGQPEAVRSICDVVSVGRARLNDSSRPLGTFLFPGPTGVGKTHCAKSLAKCLYGDVSRLLRFDMNEFQTSWAVSRLVGTFDQLDGLLTSAVRRQPYCVILFDEIEKAHPDINDLLLQVLGEARLSDSLGRTIDFSGAVIILTSNLGAREAAGRVGLGTSTQESTAAAYMKAVRAFFRPEFVNRFDRIIPFRPLQKDDIRSIADSLMSDLLQREGFLRRKCCIDLSPRALEHVVEHGYQPDMGARAMRRALEQQIVRPVSQKLAEINPETPSIVEITADRAGLQADVLALQETEPLPFASQPLPEFSADDFQARMARFMSRMEAAIEPHLPSGPLSTGSTNDQHYWYFGVTALLRELEELLNAYRDHLSQPSAQIGVSHAASKQDTTGMPGHGDHEKPMRVLKGLMASTDVHAFLDSLRRQADSEQPSTQQHRILDVAKLLELLKPREDGWAEDSVLLITRALTQEDLGRDFFVMANILRKFVFRADDKANNLRFGWQICKWYDRPVSEFASGQLGSFFGEDFKELALPHWQQLLPADRVAEFTHLHLMVSVVTGYRAAELVQRETGTVISFGESGAMTTTQIHAEPLHGDETAATALLRVLDRETAFRWNEVVAVDDWDTWFRRRINLRTPLSDFEDGLLPQLPPPSEFGVFLDENSALRGES